VALVHVLDCGTLETDRDPVSDLEIIEAWAGGQYYGSFRVHDIHEVEDRRKAFSVAPIWGARSYVGADFKFKRGALQYFSKKVAEKF
jgi:hypothetical protein